MIGTTVWAKPDKPGKPSRPEPETADYEIKIGEGSDPQHITLDPPSSYLLVQDLGYSGRWLPPPSKGKKNIEGWSIGLEKSEGDYCGTYDINKQDLIAVLIDNEIYPITDKAVYRFYIQHRLTLPWTGDVPPHPSEKADYWHILIDFELGTFGPIPGSNPPIDGPHLLMLVGDTDTGPEPEGEYDENTDTWTVYFNETWFRVTENTESGEIEELWAGQLSFTVKIKRSLIQS